MNIDRNMVHLFFDIKRNLPLTLQEDLKISAPNLDEKMVQIYTQSNDESVKFKIEVFMQGAGDDWLAKLGKKPSILGKFNPKKAQASNDLGTTKSKARGAFA